MVIFHTHLIFIISLRVTVLVVICSISVGRFLFQFYQRNGQPYPICDTDNLFVEVTEGARRVATLSELGGTDPSAANVAVVKFTVRHAGQYKISVIIGSCHVHGSPFVKTFLPGKLFLRGKMWDPCRVH